MTRKEHVLMGIDRCANSFGLHETLTVVSFCMRMKIISMFDTRPLFLSFFLSFSYYNNANNTFQLPVSVSPM